MEVREIASIRYPVGDRHFSRLAAGMMSSEPSAPLERLLLAAVDGLHDHDVLVPAIGSGNGKNNLAIHVPNQENVE